MAVNEKDFHLHRCRFADRCGYYKAGNVICDLEPGPICWAWREFRQKELKKRR